jgi:hypothetical protein
VLGVLAIAGCGGRTRGLALPGSGGNGAGGTSATGTAGSGAGGMGNVSGVGGFTGAGGGSFGVGGFSGVGGGFFGAGGGFFGVGGFSGVGGGFFGVGGFLGAGGASVACAPPVARAASVVSDFRSGTSVLPQEGRAGGWYQFFEGDNDAAHPNHAPGRINPPKTTAGIPVDGIVGGPCSGPGSLRQRASGVIGWGFGLGTSLAPTVGGKHGFFDAAAYGYRGVRLWARCTMPTPHVAVRLPNGDTDFDAPAPLCMSYADCNAHGRFEMLLDPTWQLIDVPFNSVTQDPGAATTTRIPLFDHRRLTAIWIMIRASFDAMGVATPNDFECWFDDVHFYQ